MEETKDCEMCGCELEIVGTNGKGEVVARCPRCGVISTIKE